jgi:hypothetical protein
LKAYQSELCYFASVPLRDVRDAYAGSLGKGEPGPGKIPSFGPGKALPAERGAPACALVGESAFVPSLTADITEAARYYEGREYERDQFAKGKLLHERLTTAFRKLGPYLDALGVALSRQVHTEPAEDVPEPTATRAAMDSARALTLVCTAAKFDAAKYRTTLAQFVKANAAQRHRAGASAIDPWSAFGVSLDSFENSASAAALQLALKGDAANVQLGVITSFVAVLDAQQRAVVRSGQARTRAELEPPPARSSAPEEP